MLKLYDGNDGNEFAGKNMKNMFFSFKNGYTVSVAYGAGSYSHSKSKNEFKTVEVAVLYNDKLVLIDGDGVLGYVTVEDLAKILYHYSSTESPGKLSLSSIKN